MQCQENYQIIRKINIKKDVREEDCFPCLNKTGFRLVSWQQQSCPSDLIKSAQCTKSWESMGKYEKMFLLLFLRYKWYFFGVQNKFFGVQEEKIECAVQTFAASFPPYGASLAALWCKFCHLLAGVLPSYVKFLKHSTKVCCIFQGGGGV